MTTLTYTTRCNNYDLADYRIRESGVQSEGLTGIPPNRRHLHHLPLQSIYIYCIRLDIPAILLVGITITVYFIKTACMLAS